MEFPKELILTLCNFFAWKHKMELHLLSRGLYRLTMGKYTKSTSSIEKYKYLNKMDEVYGIICSIICPDLLFHISSFKTPDEVWTTMQGVFVKHD
jgi:hypothetical protein